MKEHTDREASSPQKQGATPAARAVAGRAPAAAAPSERLLALQRMVGNRAATRTLARWTAHPDKDKKGVLLPDSVAAEYVRFNPPKNQ